MKPPAKASPAPVGSKTSSNGYAGAKNTVSPVNMNAPCSPFLMMTSLRGPKLVIIKKGEHGAFMFTGDTVFFAPAYPLEEVFDPTGAGDAFAGGFMGYLAKCGDISDASLRRA